MFNYDYEKFAELTYEKALDHLNSTNEPEEVPCMSLDETSFHYEQGEGFSFVPEVCFYRYFLLKNLIMI